jgi:hypothetical protein
VNDPRPAIEPFLARLCGGEVTDKNCVGYFMNEFGEELVFAQRRGEKTGRLWHGPDQMVSIRQAITPVDPVVPSTSMRTGLCTVIRCWTTDWSHGTCRRRPGAS